MNLWYAWRELHDWERRRNALDPRVDVSLEAACAERVLPDYVNDAARNDPDGVRVCAAAVDALWAWCAESAQSSAFPEELADAVWEHLPSADENDRFRPPLGLRAHRALGVISRAVRAPTARKNRRVASLAAFDQWAGAIAEPAAESAYAELAPLGSALITLADGIAVRMIEVCLQDEALGLAESLRRPLDRSHVRWLSGQTGSLLASRGAQMLAAYRDLLESHAAEYATGWEKDSRRGAVVLWVERSRQCQSNEPERRRGYLERALTQARQVLAEDLEAYVEAAMRNPVRGDC